MRRKPGDLCRYRFHGCNLRLSPADSSCDGAVVDRDELVLVLAVVKGTDALDLFVLTQRGAMGWIWSSLVRRV